MSLDIKRKKLELAQVQTAKLGLEFKIEERKEEIDRLLAQVKIQEERENQIIKEINEMN